MNAVNDGGPAFPTQNEGQTGSTTWHFQGMSLRDYFAAKAMQGFAAEPNAAWKAGANGMARCAYDWADAMLKAREQTKDAAPDLLTACRETRIRLLGLAGMERWVDMLSDAIEQATGSRS